MIDDEKLVNGLRNGDKQIFEEVYRDYYISLSYYCLRYVETLDDSQEIVQDLFVKLWEKRNTLIINTSLKAYLYRSVQNYALNFLAKRKTRESYLLSQAKRMQEDLHHNPEMEEEELRAILKHAILQLPEKRRRIFELSRFEGMKYNRIAEKLSISVKTVETQMSKALKYLRVVLKDYAPVLFYIVLISSLIR